MRENELIPPKGSKHSVKRIGRGVGSGHGTYACKGLKGQKSRSGFSLSPGFEGGQNPLTKRMPEQRGFTNIFRTEYTTVNVSQLNRFESDAEITPEQLVAERLVKSLKRPIKILGGGELEKPLVVRANKFTQTAKMKIESAGGKAEEIG
ncbi:MAG: 50S ribosomal protein L15 [Chloroflexota bacterium]|nr:50S ribosomal protein L15 [Chloroflexota bacterium]